MHTIIIFPSCTAANCGDPPPPSDGYLEPYTSTIEGARVNRVHVCQNGQVETEEIVCNSDGQWEVSRNSACTIKPSINIANNMGYHSCQNNSFIKHDKACFIN